MKHFQYSIPENRTLSGTEKEILKAVLSLNCPARVSEIDDLLVVARCGCGQCPTILFQDGNFDNKEIISEAQGIGHKGGLTGIIVWGLEGKIIELEAWSIDGSEIFDWPLTDSIRSIEFFEE